MREAKDLFSKQAETYASYRPAYPAKLYEFLYEHVLNFNTAWDCASGNGHTAKALAKKFKMVHATDISEQLLRKAPEKPNIRYKVERAEQTSFMDDTFDLVTVGTALHWLDFKTYYPEVKRVARNRALFAAWAYSPCRATREIDAVMDHYFGDILGEYWDIERKYVNEEYQTVPFPFEEIPTPKLHIETEWNRDQYKGFLRSWSSTQNYINKHHVNPLTFIEEELNSVFPEGKKIKIIFPLFMRAGIVLK